MRRILAHIDQVLCGRYQAQELDCVRKALCLELLGLDEISYFTKENLPENPERDLKLDCALERLAAGEPLQYVIGTTPFCGLTFNVGPGVLIPRPETGELVEWVVADTAATADILDIGTGSGCIAVSIASKLPGCKVSAWDISDDALRIARSNNELNGTHVTFEKHDVLALDLPGEKFNVIVSNPPYVTETEKADMEKTVLEHEPHLALFVPDDDPLLFYRTIAMYGKKALTPRGNLYFEINPLYAQELKRLLEQMGYHNVTLRKDIFGKLRMIKATANE